MTVASILWRRLDMPGHDACRLDGDVSAWRLEGTAVFLHGTTPAQLAYSVACDLRWRTREGYVHGWLGAETLEFVIARSEAGAWTLNGVAIPGLDTCFDLDLGFTPATNLLALRRLALQEGEAADAPAAWFDPSTRTLEVLSQRYERRTETAYWYESPGVGYAALLDVDPIGFIRRYPGLWEQEH